MPVMQHPNSNDSSADVFQMTLQQKHDLKAALLSLRWVAEIFEKPQQERPADTLIAGQLRKSHDFLLNILTPLLKDDENTIP